MSLSMAMDIHGIGSPSLRFVKRSLIEASLTIKSNTLNDLLAQLKRRVPPSTRPLSLQGYKHDGSTDTRVGTKSGRRPARVPTDKSACATYASLSRLSAYQANFKKCGLRWDKFDRSRCHGAFEFQRSEDAYVPDQIFILPSHLAIIGKTPGDFLL
jgi:hypothetical protein